MSNQVYSTGRRKDVNGQNEEDVSIKGDIGWGKRNKAFVGRELVPLSNIK